MKEFTLPEYIANPLGDATIPYREMYKKIYTDKLDEILKKRDYERIKYHLYYTKDDEYYIHFKLPSESLDDLTYDVVLYFYPNKKNPDSVNSSTISNHYVKFFSNDQNFNYVYAYTFKKEGLLIKDLIPKLNQYALKTSADIKNPNKNVGYIKSIYLSYLLMRKYGMFHKNSLKMYGTRYSKSTLLNQVMSFDEKTNEYQLKHNEKINKNKVKKEENKRRTELKRSTMTTDNTKNINKIETVDSIQSVETIKGTKNSIKVRKIKKV